MKLFKEKLQPYLEPHKWFAWYPVWAWSGNDLNYVWLTYVIRTNGYHLKYKYLVI